MPDEKDGLIAVAIQNRTERELRDIADRAFGPILEMPKNGPADRIC